MPNSLLPISPYRALLFCLLLSLFELLTYVGSDVIMPGMLNVVSDLQAENSYVPLSLNAYLLGGVAFQWLIGPLSDRVGRRPLLLFGCMMFTMACLATYWVNDIRLFIALRFIQGIGLGFVIVVSYPALQECFAESDAVRLMAIFSNIALLSPLLGPLIGSALLSFMTWRMLFILIAVLAALVWMGLFWLMPETIGVIRKDGSKLPLQPLQVGSIIKAYLDLLYNRRFMSGSIALGLIGLPIFAWIALSPLLLVHNLGMSMTEYALWQFPVFGALIAGNFALNYTIKHFSIEQLLRMALLPVLCGLAFALVTILITDHVIALITGLSIYAFGLGICNATLYRITLFSSDSGKGTVSAMLGMISVAIFGLGSILLTTLGAGNSLEAYIIGATFSAFAAALPILYLCSPSRENLIG
ncbi:sugar (and other) transporter family protein [Yersinia rochesterensis]|uniref:Multidrug transporter MdfA n=1 Tax=Yersinia rochesterensis TaxID=1604335 RepID=A0A386HEQ3_9GAMM|nr:MULTISPECIES: MdfA family multidrug efflux MFS transporter [Yersinia]AJI87786.1 sugar (and other) transporter family protein [Yersinia frederiksenii Y225]CNH36380.1 multidrug translocase [Yersinia kristensenii]AIN17265.1 sugar (and other) transporter family protein [Yersinia rochesterensis]AJJ34604.1 sugar (and other) transporter family protein [Yersinia rochesterensis]AYD44089.1 MdfA family multidrug efflux MFS transporter [Yersinia rochesterensis]